MKSRNFVILAIVVLALAGYILLFERHQPTTDERQERADRVFPELDRDQVQGVELTNSHGRFRLERSGERWRLVEPIAFEADPAAVSSLLTSIETLSSERRLSSEEVDAADYGLDQPVLAVALTTTEGDSFELEVGDEIPLGSKRALRRGGDGDILLADGWFTSDLDKELDEWRSRDVVEAFADQLASLDMVAGADRVRAVREGSRWRLIEPIEDLADRDHLQALISDLNGLRIEEFLDGEVDEAELGLDEPAFRLTLVTSEGSDPIRLDFGAEREAEGSTEVACRRNGREHFWVTDRALIRLAKAPVRWRSQKVFHFDSWDVERLQMTAGDEQLGLSRDEGIWQLEDGGEVEYQGVQERLSRLARLEAIEFDLLLPSAGELGRIELTLEPTGDAEPEVVRYSFFRPMAEGGSALVQVSARDTVMSVDADEAAAIVADPASLRKPEPTPIAEPEADSEELDPEE